MKHSSTVITFPYDMACDIKYLPTARHKKPHTIRGSHRVCGSIPILEEKDFPLAFIVTTYRTVCPKAKTQKDLSEHLPTKAGYFPIHVRAYNGKLYLQYQYGFGAVETTCGAKCGVKNVEGLKYEVERYFASRNYGIKMTPQETGKFLDKSIQLEEHIYELSKRQSDDRKYFIEFCNQYVSFKGKLWIECGEPFYHYMTFGMGHGNGGTAFFVAFAKQWLTWHEGSNVYNAFHREKCLKKAREIATQRGDSMNLLTNPKENIQVFLPKLVKIKENIF